MTLETLFVRIAPFLFVFIWSTGWVAAGYAAPHADALTFLTVRFSLAALLLAAISLAFRAAWPATPRAWAHALVAGALIHGIYLSGVWVAVRLGLPAGISGLIAALQPILTAAFTPLILGEKVTAMRWIGTVIGFAGIVLVLAPKLVGVEPAALGAVLIPIIINIIGMFSVTFGTFYQRRFLQTGDLRTMTAVQYVGAVMITAPLMLGFETMQLDWNITIALTMLWSVVVLSLGGIGLYLWLIRRGELARATTLIYLVPAMVALEAYLLFGEKLTLIQILGMIVTVLGVMLATRPAKAG
jgi:drug/metabolite transporter (DMT)-like permease